MWDKAEHRDNPVPRHENPGYRGEHRSSRRQYGSTPDFVTTGRDTCHPGPDYEGVSSPETDGGPLDATTASVTPDRRCAINTHLSRAKQWQRHGMPRSMRAWRPLSLPGKNAIRAVAVGVFMLPETATPR